MSNLYNEVKRPDNDKDVLDAIFSAIHPEQGFFKFIDITFHKLRWKLTSDDYNYFKNILLETGYFTQEFIAADGYNHNNSMPDIRLKPITKYLKAIHAAGSYSKYIFNNGMKTSAETLNIILTQLATVGSPSLVQFKSRKIVSLFNCFVVPAVGRSEAQA